MSSIDKRGETVAWVGFGWSVVGAIILAVLAISTYNTSSGVWAAGFQLLGAAGIWLLTVIMLHQKRLMAEERLEIAELERQRAEKLGGAQTIFDEEDLDQMERLASGRRLRTIERYLAPTFALLIAAYHAAVGLTFLPWFWGFPPLAEHQDAPVEKAMMLAVFCGGIAFVNFVLARYALGMSRLKDWQVMCAGGNFSFGASAVSLAVAISLLCANSGLGGVEIWVAWIIGGLLVWLAIETIINFILDIYRPRVPGQRQRPFYDSRLFGVFSEPSGIVRSVANTIDYQFGFKVSETWFYKLLGRAIVPLLFVQIIVIFALTCIVVVPPGHKAVIEHLGPWGSDMRAASPGIHLAWFWPIDRATMIPVERIQRMELGHEERLVEYGDGIQKPILWTKAHYKKEHKLLVGDRTVSEGAAAEGTEVPVNLLSMSVPVQWHVKSDDAEVIRFYSQHEDVEAIVESLAYRELTRYAAQADILDLLGEGGIDAAETLHANIQAACDEAGVDGKGLGVKIVHVGIGGVHPPSEEEVASTYEQVVSAFEQRDATIKRAEGDAAREKVGSAGLNWKAIYDVIASEDRAREAGSSDLRRQTETVENALRRQVGGAAREMVAEADARALGRVFREKSAAERYAIQTAAYEAAPSTYTLRTYLRVLIVGLQDVHKYVVAMDDSSKLIYEYDLKPPQGIDILGAELRAGEMERDAR